MIDHHTALIFTMILASAADSKMTDAELAQIGGIVNHLPIFGDFDTEKLPGIAETCAALLAEETGLDEAISAIKEALPERLRETAYALACDVTAADGVIAQEELRLLEMLRHGLDIPRLSAAAIERAAAARYVSH